MGKLELLIKSLRGPRLYHICDVNSRDTCVDYTSTCQTPVERWCHTIFDSYGWLATIIQYLSPFIVYNVYKHGMESYIAIARVSVAPLISVYFLVYFLQGTARFFTPSYVDFVSAFHQNLDTNSRSGRELFLRQYDFDFHRWNPDFKATYGVAEDSDCHGTYNIPFLLKPFYYLTATWVAKPLAFPGATYPINAIMRAHLNAGRVNHMLIRNISRAKLETVDKNHIDTVFVDNRVMSKDGVPREGPGKRLVIASEGNAGFYEVGCFEHPLKEGYSALGWNHPGFGYSTGTPFATADANAIEAVYEYATSQLGFAPKDITVYGWSIGGYPSSYIANSHPDIGNVILDASFDDILPLAIPRMPDILSSVTVNCCRKYFNLNNAKLIAKYMGPIRIIRRTNDEIISTNGYASGNRGNQLLIAVLESRYPALFTDEGVREMVDDWLDQTSPVPRRLSVPGGYDMEFCKEQIRQSGEVPDQSLGNGLSSEQRIMLAYYLFSKHITDCEGGHNSPLPRKYFKMPWKKSDELQ